MTQVSVYNKLPLSSRERSASTGSTSSSAWRRAC